MRIGNLEVTDPVPELNKPHALAIIRPWLDLSNVGSLVLQEIEKSLNAKILAKLDRPGDFFDFTRYRPTLTIQGNKTQTTFPTTVIHYGRLKSGQDLLLMNILEPHSHAESYVESIIDFLNFFNVGRYSLIGSVYDLIPYTRPLFVTGNASDLSLRNELAVYGVVPSEYQGQTSALSIIAERAQQSGIETCSFVVHLPNYLVMADDYRGKKRLIEIISNFYSVPLSQEDTEKAREQEDRVKVLAEQFLQENPQGRIILQQLEESYDARVKNQKQTQLSPEVEKFLREVSNRFKEE